jgi:hypothetical protein
MRMRVWVGGLCYLLLCVVLRSPLHAHACFSWWVVFSLVVCYAARLVLHMRSLRLFRTSFISVLIYLLLKHCNGKLYYFSLPCRIMYFTLLPRFIICRLVWNCSHLVPGPLVCPLYQHRVIDKSGAVGEIRIGRGNWNTQTKPLPIRPVRRELVSTPCHCAGNPETCCSSCVSDISRAFVLPTFLY